MYSIPPRTEVFVKKAYGQSKNIVRNFVKIDGVIYDFHIRSTVKPTLTSEKYLLLPVKVNIEKISNYMNKCYSTLCSPRSTSLTV